jgi:PAS domain S-box-containing protein
VGRLKDHNRTDAQLLEELTQLRRKAQLSEAVAEEFLRTRKALEDERVFIADALNSLMDIFYVLGADGRLLRWNNALKEVSGYSDDELSSMTVFDLIDSEHMRSRIDFVQTLLERGQTGIEAIVVAKDGRRIPYYFHSTMLMDSTGEPLMISGVGRDISEQRKAEDELMQYRERLEELVEDRTLQIMMTNEKLQNEIDERVLIEEELRARNDELATFAHTISHDLRGSVSIIKGYAQVALEGKEDLLQECLEKIVYLAHRMDGFIASLLAYSEAGRPEGKPVPVRPCEVLAGILAERETEIEARNIEVVIEEELPAVKVDPVRLHQVFINLLDNAFKYLGDNPAPKVRCGVSEEESAVVFYVADNGMGIVQGEHEKVFEPFERLGVENHYGLGIGLSTVKRAVEGWGGRVWVESTPGEGSTFFFTIPLSASL